MFHFDSVFFIKNYSRRKTARKSSRRPSNKSWNLLEELDSSIKFSDSDSDSDNSINDFPSVTGNSEIDEMISIHPDRFEKGIFQPRSREQAFGINIDLLLGIGGNESCRVFQTSEGIFIITQKKKHLNDKHQLAQICRNILCALNDLTSLEFPRNYQNFIIRQVVGQDHFPMPFFYDGANSNSDESEDDVVGNYASQFQERR